MLTKEECLKALEMIVFVEGYYDLEHMLSDEKCCSLKYKMMFDLINEHFDNPPLKWEELKEGMWVWDSYRKLWFTVDAMFTNSDTKIKYFMDFRSVIEFEENRLYRKQVEQ